MHDAPSTIVLIVAPSVSIGKIHARSDETLRAGLGLGQVRIVTNVRGLRGWRRATPIIVVETKAEFLDNEMLQAIEVYCADGRMRLAGPHDLEGLRKEIAA